MIKAKPATTQMSQSSIEVSLYVIRKSRRAFGRDHPGVHAGPSQSAEKPAMLDLHAMVLDHLQSGGLGAAPRVRIAHAQLHPQHLRADRARVLGERGDLLALAEAIDDVHGL